MLKFSHNNDASCTTHQFVDQFIIKGGFLWILEIIQQNHLKLRA